MKLLLDTHVLVWSAERPEELGKRAGALLLDAANELYVSAVSILEIARLAAHGHLELRTPVDVWCERARRAIGAESVAVDDRVALEAYAIPGVFHADPADRILVATARVHGLQLVTADKRILGYKPVRTYDARR